MEIGEEVSIKVREYQTTDPKGKGLIPRDMDEMLVPFEFQVLSFQEYFIETTIIGKSFHSWSGPAGNRVENFDYAIWGNKFPDWFQDHCEVVTSGLVQTFNIDPMFLGAFTYLPIVLLWLTGQQA